MTMENLEKSQVKREFELNCTSPSIVVTDLDGTLLDTDRKVSADDYQSLVLLGEKGIVRVAATGRSQFSARKVLAPDFPIDYLVFSSGAGIMDWRSQELLISHSLSVDNVRSTVDYLLGRKLDFMVHRPIPDNHFFLYHRGGGGNPDFERRLDLYQDYCSPLKRINGELGESCQILAILKERNTELFERIKSEITTLNVILATSPLDGASLWVEFFPLGVSKANGALWIAKRLGLDTAGSVAVGNDYNDLDLLRWAKQSFVVSNAPQELRREFQLVRSHCESGFSEAIERFL